MHNFKTHFKNVIWCKKIFCKIHKVRSLIHRSICQLSIIENSVGKRKFMFKAFSCKIKNYTKYNLKSHSNKCIMHNFCRCFNNKNNKFCFPLQINLYKIIYII